MLISVLLPKGEEGLFNADCLVAGLLQAVRRKHHIALGSDPIDLCTTDGCVKELYHHLNENGERFFHPRELCLVVRVTGLSSGHPTFVPVLPEYSKNQDFVAALNHHQENKLCVRVMLKNKPPQLCHKPPYVLTAERGKGRHKTTESRGKKRRESVKK